MTSIPPPSAFDTSGIVLPEPPARVHIIGVGGAGNSGLARMLHGRGYRVSGSDMYQSDTTDELKQLGVDVRIGHNAQHVAGAALVVSTAAAREDNPEIVAARAAGTPVVKGKAIWGVLANPKECIAIAGTHGKSTTSGMTALALERAGLEPSFAVGATVRELGTNARLSGGRHFVVEADEYDYSFLWLRPQVAIVTTVEFDHPDLFADFDAVLEAFARFVGSVREGGTLVVAADDTGCGQLLERADTSALRVVTFGEDGGDCRVRRDGATWRVEGPDGQVFALPLAVPGRHNARNALAVLAASGGMGVDPQALLPGLSEFGGVSRRFQVRLDTPALTVVDDYAHHPTEIAVSIAAARERYPGRRIMAIFQPHTYSRTKALLPEFARALDAADFTILAAIYASRETDHLGIYTWDVREAMTSPGFVTGSPSEAAKLALSEWQEGDVMLVMGAGDIIDASEEIVIRSGLQ